MIQKRNTANIVPATPGLLTKLLTSKYLLYGRTREAHWNMYGPDFNGNCPYFEYQFSELAQIIDSVADCLPDSGGYSYSLLNPSNAPSGQNEARYHKKNSSGYLLELLDTHQGIIEGLNEITLPVHCYQTTSLMDELLEVPASKHHKMADALRFRPASHYNQTVKSTLVPGTGYSTPRENIAYAY